MRRPAAIGASGKVNQGNNMGGRDPSSALRLTLLVCLAEIFGLSSMGVFPSLLPTFQCEWGLSHTEAGWISAAYYTGYMALVPLLSSVTDRIDARRIMGIGAICGIVGAVAYALLAQGFWSALILRFLAGTGLAVHSTLGFGAAFLGPLAVGMVLDLFGGHLVAWGMGFSVMAAGCLLGPVFLYSLGSKTAPPSRG